ncbi:MAG TPA: TonB-dependent receptor [Caulobacteraceae bacterium]|jgi:iron complex outermembrane receptor protein
MYKHLLLMTCAIGALGISAGMAQAATAADSASSTDQGATNVTEITVTAEKREQSLQKVPVAVSVFTGAQRDTIGINTVQDVTNFAPGFTYDPGNVHAYIRGVGRQSVNVTDDQRVANYEDEFYVYSPYGLDKSSLFLSSEQIERGPQNVGGRNAAAGSIDMLSVRPTDEPYAEFRGTIGNFGTHVIEGAISGEIAPGLDVRIAGFDKNQDFGYYRNLAGGPSEGNTIHEWYVEGQADWKPNDKFELWTRTFFETWQGYGDAGSRTGFANGSWDETNLTDANSYVGGGLFINPNYGYAALVGGNPAAAAGRNPADPVVTNVTLLNPAVRNNPSMNGGPTAPFAAPITRSVSLNNYDDFNYIATYHFDNFDVKYNGGVQGYDYHLNYDGGDTDVASFTLAALPGVTPLTINPLINSNYEEDDWWTSHDLSFQSTTDSPLQWTAGGFFFYQHYNQPYDVSDPLQPQLAAPAGAAPNPHHDILYLDYQFNVLSAAGYGQMSYKINDKWKITGNLRYTYDDKTGTEAARYIVFSSATLDLPAAALLPTLPAAVAGLPASLVFGSNMPALDITGSQTCLSGTPNTLASPNACNGNLLGKGVTSKGVITPSGYAFRNLGIQSNAVTGGAGIEFQPTEDIFTYFRYGRGYEAPSFNAGQVLANPAVGQEDLNSYEIGYKQSFGKNLLVDGAIFYYDYEGLQLPISVTNGGVTQSQFINVPKAESYGLELEVYWTPVKDLSVTASYSYDKTSILTGCSGTVTPAGVFTQSANALCLIDTNDPDAVQPGANPFPGQNPAATRAQSVKGDPLPDAPQNKVAIAVSYTWHFDPGSLTFNVTGAWRDVQDGTVFNRFYDNAPSWGDLDLRAIWKGQNDKYEIIGFVKNVTNALQYDVGSGGIGEVGNATSTTNAAKGLFEQNLTDLAPPRTYGVEFRYKFF